ncbi:MAG: hypothetical protein IBX55_13015 [Methyloprofundus sp.]|nr:hypothetical protein [Methyloprofundus sp.]
MSIKKISIEASKVISQPDKAKRAELAGDNETLQAEVKKHWKNGIICGQCKRFCQLGGRGSGLNGMCSSRSYPDYTKPYQSCELFERLTQPA